MKHRDIQISAAQLTLDRLKILQEQSGLSSRSAVIAWLVDSQFDSAKDVREKLETRSKRGRRWPGKLRP